MINYGKNTMPEFLTVTHEEASVAMCHGHFKATGKPQMALMHGTVGLQHAAMAVYNAWADRVPLIMIGGNDLDASKRPPGVPTVHSAQDINALVRDFTKWDDQPVSLQHFSQSFVRAYKYAMTPPYGPVMLALDAGVQQASIKPDEKDLYTPRYVRAVTAARRPERAARGRQASGQCAEPGHRRGPLRAYAGGHRLAGSTRRADPVPGGEPAEPRSTSPTPIICRRGRR